MEFEPKIFRTIIFVRHGQYSRNPETLTRLGKKQAQLTAKALVALKPSKLHCSTMPRATETADILAQHLDLKFEGNEIFCEGLLPGTPAFHKSITKGKSAAERNALLADAKATKKNADRAFKSLFKPPQRGRNIEVVVAHGNVIRHWVCKALNISEEKWLKMDVSHASLTTIRVSSKGYVMLLGFADTGHLPINMRTYV